MAKAKQQDDETEVTETPETNGKNRCPVTRDQFLKGAKPVLLTLDNGAQLVLGVKQFSTGSFGWHANGRVVITVDGVPVTVQANVGFTVIDSKKS